jgi:hypothetical protein
MTLKDELVIMIGNRPSVRESRGEKQISSDDGQESIGRMHALLVDLQVNETTREREYQGEET